MSKKPGKRGRPSKRNSFIAKVSNYGSKNRGRKHIEVPREKRKEFNSGILVSVKEIKN